MSIFYLLLLIYTRIFIYIFLCNLFVKNFIYTLCTELYARLVNIQKLHLNIDNIISLIYFTRQNIYFAIIYTFFIYTHFFVQKYAYYAKKWFSQDAIKFDPFFDRYFIKILWQRGGRERERERKLMSKMMNVTFFRRTYYDVRIYMWHG